MELSVCVVVTPLQNFMTQLPYRNGLIGLGAVWRRI